MPFNVGPSSNFGGRMMQGFGDRFKRPQTMRNPNPIREGGTPNMGSMPMPGPRPSMPSPDMGQPTIGGPIDVGPSNIPSIPGGGYGGGIMRPPMELGRMSMGQPGMGGGGLFELYNRLLRGGNTGITGGMSPMMRGRFGGLQY